VPSLPTTPVSIIFLAIVYPGKWLSIIFSPKFYKPNVNT